MPPTTMLTVAALCALTCTSCRPPEPNQVLEDVEWSQQIIEGFSVPVPIGSESSSEVFSHRHVFYSTYEGWAVGSIPVSRMIVIAWEGRMTRGWDLEHLPRADVVCQLSTFETIGRAALYHEFLLCQDGQPVAGVEIITSVDENPIDEKTRYRVDQDQRIFEYILANIRKVEDGKLVKPTIKMVGNGITRDRERAPNVMIQQLPQTIKLPDWAVDEAPAKDDPK